MDQQEIWVNCQARLRAQGLDGRAFNTWIRPLQCQWDGKTLCLVAHNEYIREHVQAHYATRIAQVVFELLGERVPVVIRCEVMASANAPSAPCASVGAGHDSHLHAAFTFERFVRGRSNEIAVAAAIQAAQNAGSPAHNPLVIYGDVGLGKTHIMHAIGHDIVARNPGAKVLYVHAERFVSDMVRALQRNDMDGFKSRYRQLDALLIDDIQFFARKERSQEELFHTFNAMLQSEQQMVLTSDRYPKELEGVEERLRSRFSWGLAVSVDPPELETRVAILMQKAELSQVILPQEVAFFIAKHIQANVRELEGALKRVIANAHFTGRPVTLDFAKEALRDLLSMQARLVSIDNIQRIVAQYYKIRVADLLSKKRTRAIARPRQMAMAMAKQLTQKSLPEIGEAFGGRDHTTVLHACRTIAKLCQSQAELKEDWDNVLRRLMNG